MNSKLENLNVTVVGAGLMGSGISLAFATGGCAVVMVDLNLDILKKSLEQIRSALVLMQKNDLLAEPLDRIMSRLSLETDLKKITPNSDLVVEAVFEDLDLKKRIFRELDIITDPRTILASNTSSLQITSIASATSHQERVVGTHFWNPPHLMQAVEVVYGENTSDEVVKRTVEILRKIGKTPAVVRRDVPGQIGIRILYSMIREAVHLIESGIATPEDIDNVVKEALGTRLGILGPLELADLSGIDLVNSVAKGLFKTLDCSSEPQVLIKQMVAHGDLGIKSGRGFYDWRNSSRNAEEILKLRDNYLIKILKERKKGINIQ